MSQHHLIALLALFLDYNIKNKKHEYNASIVVSCNYLHSIVYLTPGIKQYQ